MKMSLKQGLAVAAVAAAGLGSPAAYAVDVPCFGIANLEQCYVGVVSAPPRNASFTDWTIGNVSLDALSNLVGHFLTPGLSLSEVSLWTGSVASTFDTDMSNGISFDNVAAGDYSVRISGLVTGPRLFGHKYGVYAGGFDITPAIPEPETYALMLAGLLAICYVARRRLS